ncbi:efflux RND transporter periplasmic adaptor subunit [bacterium]|nr:efflux RND transporter periplasmic adaptor subunit [bacterium]
MKKNIIIIAAIVLIAIFLRLIFSISTGILKNKGVSKQKIPIVNVETVQLKDIIRSFEVPGRVDSVYQVNVVARISGYLQKSYFTEGSYVKKGDILFLIEPDEYKSSADIAQADIKNIKAKLDYANKQLLRAKELVKSDYIAKSRYDEILSNRDSLQAQLRSAYSILEDKKRNLNYTKIKSPIDGKVGIIDVSVGNYVTPMTGNLTTINSTNPIYVTFSLNIEDFNTLSKIDKENNKNHKVRIYFTGGDEYSKVGIQNFLDNEVDQNTGTVMLRATFDNPENELLHGELVTVKLFSNNMIKVPIVPIKAVAQNQEGKYVYKLDKKNLPQIAYIKTEGQSGDYLIVSEGLNSGDRIITDGILNVIPNQKVKIVSDK